MTRTSGGGLDRGAALDVQRGALPLGSVTAGYLRYGPEIRVGSAQICLVLARWAAGMDLTTPGGASFLAALGGRQG